MYKRLMYIKKKSLSIFFKQMNASVFYTRRPCCTLRSWTCCCVSGVFTFLYLQLWNCLGSASPGFTTPSVLCRKPLSCLPCLKPSCRRHSRTQLVPNIPNAGLRRWSANLLWAPVLFMHGKTLLECVFFSLPAIVARVAAANILTTWKLFSFSFKPSNTCICAAS